MDKKLVFRVVRIDTEGNIYYIQAANHENPISDASDFTVEYDPDNFMGAVRKIMDILDVHPTKKYKIRGNNCIQNAFGEDDDTFILASPQERNNGATPEDYLILAKKLAHVVILYEIAKIFEDESDKPEEVDQSEDSKEFNGIKTDDKDCGYIDESGVIELNHDLKKESTDGKSIETSTEENDLLRALLQKINVNMDLKVHIDTTANNSDSDNT